MTTVKLVDVTDRAATAGFAFEPTAPGIATWNPGTTANSAWVPVYVTEALWSALGEDDAQRRGSLTAILQDARTAIETRVVAQNAWRASFQTDVQGRVLSLWVILTHSFSNGIAIGYGPGDFWAA